MLGSWKAIILAIFFLHHLIKKKQHKNETKKCSGGRWIYSPWIRHGWWLSFSITQVRITVKGWACTSFFLNVQLPDINHLIFGGSTLWHARGNTSHHAYTNTTWEEETHMHTHWCHFTYLYRHEGTYRTRQAHITLAPSSSYCIMINGVSPVPVATGPCSGPLGARGCLVAFLPGFLSPDSAPAVHTSRKKNTQRVKIIHWRFMV